MGLFFGILLSVSTFASNGSQAPTREYLYKESTIPEKREYKLSNKYSPCDDFHKYVCSETENFFQLPPSRNGYTFAVNDNYERLVHAKNRYLQLLSQEYKPTNPRASQLKPFFSACMDESSSLKDERSFVGKQKSEILAIATREELQNFIQSRAGSPLNVFLSGEVDADLDSPAHFDYSIFSKLMSLPDKSYYKNQATRTDFESVVSTFFKSIGEKESKAKAKIVVKIESQFAEIFPSSSEVRQRGARDTYWLRERWLSSYPKLPLRAIFERLPAKTRIRNKTPEAMEYTDRLLASASLEEIKTYLLYATLKERIDDGYQDYFMAKFKFEHKHLGGPAQRHSRDERCTRTVMNSFPFEVDAELTPVLFENFPKEKVRSIAEQVRRALVEQLKENTWLSESAKAEAIKKMETAKLSIATPDREEDWDFRPLTTYSETQPIQNQLKLEQAIIDQKFERMKKEKNRDLWYLGPLVFNAFYVPEDNRLSILQAMLQPPYFDLSRTEIENIAAVGSMAGHELGHGIDDKGSRRDHTGKLRQWMSESDLTEFKKRTSRFEKRFNEIGHDGSLTLGENVGDHIGIRAAFRAAFPRSLKDDDKKDLQRFFVSYARTFCEVNRPEFEKLLLKTDSHAMGRARINEQVMNLEGFSKAFSCKPGNRMYRNEQQRFVVW
jgi:putative endopeptidase